MARRPQASAGRPAGGPKDSEGDTAVLDGRDALGNDRDDVQLEDALLTEGDGSKKADAAEAVGEEARRKALGLETFVDARDALAKGFRERRAAARSDAPAPLGDAPVEDQDELEDGDQQDNGEAEPGEVVIIGKDGQVVADSGAEVRQPGDVDQPAPRASRTREAAPADPDAIPDDRQVTMVVDGANVRMTYGEMRRIAQQNIASESRLRQANDLLDRARRTTDSTSTRTDPGRRDQADPAPQETRTRPTEGQQRIKIDPSTVKGLVSKIQLGDDDEAAAALAEAISLGVEAGQAQRGQTNAGGRDVRAEVDDAFVERAANAEVNQALRTVAEEHGDIIGSPILYPGAMVIAHQAAVENLRKIGVPEADLRLPAMEVFKGYATLRQDPQWRDKLEPMADVFVGAAESVRQEIGLPAPQPRREAPRLPTRASQQPTRIQRTSDDRSGRKALVTGQPRSSSVRTDFSGNGVAPKKTPAADVIAGVAASRGQFTGTRQ